MSKLLDKLEKSQKDYGGKLGFNKSANENIYPQILIVGKYSSYSFKSKKSGALWLAAFCEHVVQWSPSEHFIALPVHNLLKK